MSGSWIGMDTTEVDSLATQFDSEATVIENAITSITSKLSTTTWQGPDRVTFENDWTSTTSVQLRTAAEALRTAATTARKNSSDQTTTSASL